MVCGFKYFWFLYDYYIDYCVFDDFKEIDENLKINFEDCDSEWFFEVYRKCYIGFCVVGSYVVG